MVVQVCSSSTGDAEVGGLRVQSHSRLYSETPSKKKNKKNKNLYMRAECANHGKRLLRKSN